MEISLASLPQILPRHVAIIMDGNGRWARKRHLPREAGHLAGMNAVRETVRAACDIGLSNLTLFAFSSENWKRPKAEVGALMGLFRTYFRNDMDELVERNVRMRIIGHRGRVASDIHEMILDPKSAPPRIQVSISLSPSTMAARKRSPPPPASWRARPRRAGLILRPSRPNSSPPGFSPARCRNRIW